MNLGGENGVRLNLDIRRFVFALLVVKDQGQGGFKLDIKLLRFLTASVEISSSIDLILDLQGARENTPEALLLKSIGGYSYLVLLIFYTLFYSQLLTNAVDVRC